MSGPRCCAMNPTPHTLTLAVIARDEAAVIARCLESAAGIAAEMIVVDTGSIDATREIAQRMGARVLDFKWVDDFSAARNKGLDAATGRWILVLDADEYLPEPSAAAILDLLQATPTQPCAFHLLNKSSSDEGKTGMVGKIVRLFPNLPDVRFEWPVHEQVVTSLRRAQIPIYDTGIEIIHTGYANASINQSKQARNLAILDAFIAATPRAHPMAYFLRGGALLDLGRLNEALEAYTLCQFLPEIDGQLHSAAVTRRATCLAELGRFEEIRSLSHPTLPRLWHPEHLVLHARAESVLGNPTGAIEFLNLVFDSPDTASIPAYDPVRVRGRAIMLLSEILAASQPLAALNLLRLTAESLKTGHKITLQEITSLLAK